MSPSSKLIAIDIDGTLLDASGRVTQAVRAAVANAAAAGVTVVLASGRRYRSTAPIAVDIEAAPLVIVQHGALIKRTHDASTVHSALINMPLALEAAEFMLAEKLEPMIGVDGFSEGLDFYVHGGKPRHSSTLGFTDRSKGLWKTVRNPAQIPYRGATAVFATGEKDALVKSHKRLAEHFADVLSYHLLKSPQYDFWFLEAISPNGGKGRALLALARRLDIQPENTAAIGDDVNDLDMFAAAGTAVAMGNAVEEVKKAADFTVAPNTENGAAQAIEKLLAT